MLITKPDLFSHLFSPKEKKKALKKKLFLAVNIREKMNKDDRFSWLVTFEKSEINLLKIDCCSGQLAVLYAELHKDSIFLKTHLACQGSAVHACAKHNSQIHLVFLCPSVSRACVQM